MNVHFSTIANDWLENYSKVHRKSCRKDELWLRKFILPVLGELSASRIDYKTLVHFHLSVSSKGKFQANRVLELVSAILTYGIRLGYVKDNPTRYVKRFPEPSRERHMTPDELRRFLAAVQRERYQNTRSFFLMLLATGARKSEVLGLTWDDVDTHSRLLRFRNTKNGTTHYIPMTSVIDEILKTLDAPQPGQYLFRGRFGGKRVCVSRAWRRILHRSGLTDLRLHDLRRTLATHLLHQGVSLDLIGGLLNHKDRQVTQVYARYSPEPVRQALDSLTQDWFREISSQSSESNES